MENCTNVYNVEGEVSIMNYAPRTHFQQLPIYTFILDQFLLDISWGYVC